MGVKESCEKLYELLESIGECDLPGMHIIDTGQNEMLCEGEGTFRIYHKDGYCFDVSKRVETDDEETGDALTFYYDLDTYFEGFKDITPKEAINLVTKCTRKGNIFNNKKINIQP